MGQSNRLEGYLDHHYEHWNHQHKLIPHGNSDQWDEHLNELIRSISPHEEREVEDEGEEDFLVGRIIGR